MSGWGTNPPPATKLSAIPFLVTANGIKCSRRPIASSTLRSPGFWFPAMTSLNCGMYCWRHPYQFS